MTDTQPQAEAATEQTAPKRRARASKRAKSSPSGLVLRFIGDGSVFQSGVPNRDVTSDDGLTEELIDLAVATGTHVRV